MKRSVFIAQLLLLQFLLVTGLSGQDSHLDFNDSLALDKKFMHLVEEDFMMGRATHIIKNGEVLWHRNYGYADIENRIPVSDSTLFKVNSISQTFTATAIFQLWERGCSIVVPR